MYLHTVVERHRLQGLAGSRRGSPGPHPRRSHGGSMERCFCRLTWMAEHADGVLNARMQDQVVPIAAEGSSRGRRLQFSRRRVPVRMFFSRMSNQVRLQSIHPSPQSPWLTLHLLTRRRLTSCSPTDLPCPLYQTYLAFVHLQRSYGLDSNSETLANPVPTRSDGLPHEPLAENPG